MQHFLGAGATAAAPPQGPLAAVGNMQRAIREADRRLNAADHAIAQLDAKLDRTADGLNGDGGTLRAQVAELQQLVVQRFEAYDQKLADHTNAVALQLERASSQRAAQQAALDQQQRQLEELSSAVRRQEGLIGEHIRGSAAQTLAVNAKLAELSKGFAAQAAVAEAGRAYMVSMAEKLGAQINERAAAAEQRGEAAASGLQASIGEVQQRQQTLAERAAELRAAIDAAEGGQRAALDEALAEVDSRNGAALSELEAFRSKLGAEMAACRDEGHATATRASDAAAECREEVRRAASASATALEQRCGPLADTAGMLARQMGTVGPTVGRLSATVDDLLSRAEASESAADARGRQAAESGRLLNTLSAEVRDARERLRAVASQLSVMSAEERTLVSAVSMLESKMRHVGAQSDEQGKYLKMISEELFGRGAAPHKYRQAAIVPAFTDAVAGGAPAAGAPSREAPRELPARVAARDRSPPAQRHAPPPLAMEASAHAELSL